MSFERFILPPRSRFPRATIGKDGKLRFNKAATKEYNLMNYNYGILYYDSEGQRVGVQFTNDESLSNRRAIYKKEGFIEMSLLSFCRYFEIDYSVARQYTPNYDNTKEPDMVIIDLRK